MDKRGAYLGTAVWFLAVIAISKSGQDVDEDFYFICSQRCPFQNKSEENFDIGCGRECKTEQCSKGCLLWREALGSSCQTVCNGTQNVISQKELHCVMGCNDAIYRHFQKLKDEIGIPPAPYLVADTLTATSLSLSWEGFRYLEISYLVQWRYEEHAGAWQYCKNQSWGPDSVVLVENLKPYTKYRFRVALLLSPHGDPIVSKPSVVISTLAAGTPSSPPVIIRATAVDPKRISISWKPGPFPNGPIHSYVLDLTGEYMSVKEDIEARKTTDFYMFHNLRAGRKYTISISMRNAVGEGPAATVQISTPPEPSIKDTLHPILILGSDHVVIKQGADMMLDTPAVIYETSSTITGMAIHINKNLLFVSDSRGYVSVTKLSEFGRSSHVLSPYDLTFKPFDLSVDWLNQHLYILGEVNHNMVSLWQIARCSLSGGGLNVAVAGITSKPLHIEVDPYNGYLFWVIQGNIKGGLYRLDMANLSNGIKHEVTPDIILEDPYLGAFIVDHVNYCVLVPNHVKNTIYSVSLDGRQVIDLRSNTQQPLFQNVLSLAIANGLFYWTNGEEILAEDYHEEYHTYFHNHYLGSKNRSYIAVYVDLPTSQPTPVPVNPPVQVQAILGGQVAKISWQPPHVVGGQGKGAWQNWSYELQLKNAETGLVRTIRNINNLTFYTIDGLRENTDYLIKSAAYTSSGSGPWSSEFRGKTLRIPGNGQYPTVFWSSAEGLLESDVTGEEVEILVSHENLKNDNGIYHFVDISWYRDILYMVTNTSSVHWYNLTSREFGRLHSLDSVGSVAVDWIGKKLYWSSPKQQLIIRGDLHGSSPEPLLILTIAKELKIDSENAFIYWSTGHAVECARLNGDSRRIYYPAELFSGKQVMGLTLNMDDWHIYWIVRSSDGSNLHKAPMARSSDSDGTDLRAMKVSALKHSNMQGSLCYFSDHLLWVQDNGKAIISDLQGKNLALVSGMSLFGLNVVAVKDNDLISVQDDGKVEVIPEAVDTESIRINGTASSFNITWRAVTNVNFGKVLYDVKTEGQKKETFSKVEENHMVYKGAEELPPYSELRITVQAYTYWGSSPQVVKILRSPPSLPSTPTNIRAFVTTKWNKKFDGNGNAFVILLRWDPPETPNGVVAGYKVKYSYVLENAERFFEISLDSDKLEFPLQHPQPNTTYFFQVKAFTSAGEGKYTKNIEVDPSIEAPVPLLLATTKDSIKLIDCDTKNHTTLSRGDRPIDIASNNNEGWIYWLNDMREIFGMKSDGSKKSKILALNNTGLSLAVDWVARHLYWSEVENRSPGIASSGIYRLDLNQLDYGIVDVDEIVRRSGEIEEIEVSPFSSTLYWIEMKDAGGRLMRSRTDGSDLSPLFSLQTSLSGHRCTCFENLKIGKSFSMDHTDPYNVSIVFSDWEDHYLYETGSDGCLCEILLARSSKLPPTSITTDHRYLYWSNEEEDSLFFVKEDSKIESLLLKGISKITAVGTHLQPIPSGKCLTSQKRDPVAVLLSNTPTSVVLRLPEPERDPECENISLPSIKYTAYFDLLAKNGSSPCIEDLAKCQSIISYRNILEVTDLKSFSNYVFKVSMQNFFSFLDGPITGPPVVFSTLPGAPSPPRNVTAAVLTPNIVQVIWLPANHSAEKAVFYQIHWRSEGTVEGVRQSGEQLVNFTDTPSPMNPYLDVTIKQLVPGQTYVIWVRAYSKYSSSYSESQKVEIKTFYQPDNITLVQASPYSLKIAWSPPEDTIYQYAIQFRTAPKLGDWRNVDKTDDVYYFIDNLSPKTLYGFRIVIAYIPSERDYIWPQEGEFIFETLGDKPSRPGTPFVQHLRKGVYQVQWEKSRDNGATVDFYILEGLIKQTWKSKREANYTSSSVEANEMATEEWNDYYNGTENYWIINDLDSSLKYVFRVRAKNKYGWSDFSKKSKSFDFTEAAMLADRKEFDMVLTTAVPVLLLCCVLILTIFCCVLKIWRSEKKEVSILTLNTGGNRGLGQMDVELATLRELPRRENFIQNANILYVPSLGVGTVEQNVALPHVRREQFKLTKFLGSGAFGEVFEGVAQGLDIASNEKRVAIKALRKGATEHEKAEFLKEAQLMSHFKHEHILQLLGVCLDNDPNYILMELMEGGDLLSYLRMNRQLIKTKKSIKLEDLLDMCLDVTKGCRYLEEMHFVHRDLACRNCLVSFKDSRTRIVKIGDFGLARDIYKNDYYRKEGEGLLPVRWMAPESLVDGVFTSQSDVWSFGVLIWEIMTLGQQPYPARTNLEVLHYVRTGGRLDRPINCPEELHQLMIRCWNFNPESRPTFKCCLETLSSLKDGMVTNTLSNELHWHNLIGKDESEYRCERKPYNMDGTVIGENEINDSAINGSCLERNCSIEQEPHKYLELIYEKSTEEDDGYEIPRCANSKLNDDKRTFFTSTAASDYVESINNNLIVVGSLKNSSLVNSSHALRAT